MNTLELRHALLVSVLMLPTMVVALGESGSIGSPLDGVHDGGVDAHYGAAVATCDGGFAMAAPGASGAVHVQGAIYVHPTWEQSGARVVAPEPNAFAAVGSVFDYCGDVLATTSIAPDETTRVHVFVRDQGSWALRATLSAPFGAADPDFGRSIAVSGDFLLVGAPRSSTETGRAYLYRRVDGHWHQERIFEGPPGRASFGTRVAMRGTLAVIAAPIEPARVQVHGAAYLYERSGTNWIDHGALVPSNFGILQSVGQFGSSLAIDGDRLLVGAPGSLSAGGNAGGAMVFARSAQNVWIQDGPALVDRLSGEPESGFGTAVALRGDLALIGAPHQGSQDRGKVLPFVRGAGGWQAFATPLLPVAGPDDAHFGESVALPMDDVAVIGAPGTDIGSAIADAGRSYRFVHSAGNWTLHDMVDLADGVNEDAFGQRLAVDGDTLLIAAPLENVGGIPAGAVHVYRRDDGGWRYEARLHADMPVAGDGFGASIAVKGHSAVVGIAGFDGGVENAGAAAVFVRDKQGWQLDAVLLADTREAQDAFGSAVAIDLDSEDRLIVGARRTCSSVSPASGRTAA